MHKIWKFCRSRAGRLVFGSLACFLFGLWFNLLGISPLQSATQGPLPALTITAVKREYIGQRADGTAIERHGTVIRALRPDGSTAHWEETFSGAPELAPFGQHVRFAWLLRAPVASFSIVFPESESVSTFPVEKRHMPHLATPKQCDTPPSLPAVYSSDPPTILGYRVVRRTDVVEKGDGGHIVETWQAPDLNCYSLREVYQSRDADGATRIIQTLEATSIVLGEPVPSLYEIPTQYVERSPRDAMAELAYRRGVPAPMDEGLLNSTKRYHALRNK